jgi:hypothetical protein
MFSNNHLSPEETRELHHLIDIHQEADCQLSEPRLPIQHNQTIAEK